MKLEEHLPCGRQVCNSIHGWFVGTRTSAEVFTSHTKQYLLIKNNFEHQILDTDELGKTLQSVINFLVQEELTNEKVSAYVESVIRIYKINENRNPAKLNGR